MSLISLPEDAVVDAVIFDPLGAATLLSVFATNDSSYIRLNLLQDIARKKDLSLQRLQLLIPALLAAGMIQESADGYELTVTQKEMEQHAAVLRGVAYAQYRHKDKNQIEITLSPPAQPSRLMEILPQKGFSWTQLYDTKDSLIELASQATRTFTVVSPFIDNHGLEWINQLFEATKQQVQRTLIIRGCNDNDVNALNAFKTQLSKWNARILTYAIQHDPDQRNPSIETFHAKILLSDLDKAYIGSANMNRWSRDFSMECGVTLRGPCVRPVATLIESIISISDNW